MTPSRAQSVVIRLPDAQDIQARVDEADATTVTLVLSVPQGDGVPRQPAIVEWYSPTGIHRIAGELASAPGEPAVLRLVRNGEEHVQRREWARVDAVLPVDIRFEDPESGLAATVALNVSGGGALIHDPVGLPIGTDVELELHLGDEIILASGRVVRETRDGAKGIELAAIADADRERIVRFVTARQLAELALRERRR